MTFNEQIANFLMISSKETLLAFFLCSIAIAVIFWLKRKKYAFSTRMLVATIFGWLIGFLLLFVLGVSGESVNVVAINEIDSWISCIAHIYITLLKLMVFPAVFIALLKLIIDYDKTKIKRRVVGVGAVVMILTALIAILIGIAIAQLANVGEGMIDLADSALLTKDVILLKQNNLPNMINSMFSTGIAFLLPSVSIMWIISFAILIGISINKIKTKSENISSLIKIINAVHDLIISMIKYIIKLSPFMAIILIPNFVIQNGLSIFYETLNLVAAIYFAIFIMFVVLIVLNFIFGKTNPFKYLKILSPLVNTTLNVKSSVAALPSTIESSVVNLSCDRDIATIVGKMSTQIAMNGCLAIYPAFIIMMTAHIAGIPIDWIFISFTTIVILISSVTLPNMPMKSTLVIIIALSMLGINYHFTALAIVVSLSIESFVDMARTVLNVTGGLTAINITNTILNLKFMKPRK